MRICYFCTLNKINLHLSNKCKLLKIYLKNKYVQNNFKWNFTKMGKETEVIIILQFYL